MKFKSPASLSREAGLSQPITGNAGCCARATSGHATAPPIPTMNPAASSFMPPSPSRDSLSRPRAHGNGLHLAWGPTSCDLYCSAGGGFCEGFRMTAPSRTMPRAPGAVVRKPPRKESAGSGAPGSAGTMGIWLGATGAAGVGGSRARSVEEGQSGR